MFCYSLQQYIWRLLCQKCCIAHWGSMFFSGAKLTGLFYNSWFHFSRDIVCGFPSLHAVCLEIWQYWNFSGPLIHLNVVQQRATLRKIWCARGTEPPHHKAYALKCYRGMRLKLQITCVWRCKRGTKVLYLLLLAICNWFYIFLPRGWLCCHEKQSC